MFDLNPLNVPDAPLQHWIMAVVAGFFGFMIAVSAKRNRIGALKAELASTERELANCQRASGAPAAGVADEAAVLERIRVRAGEVNFDRIGRASAAEADDLKAITGVGPFLERKLNALGIYTYRQIANLGREDMDKVNEIIEFFPGLIERDNWVGQAADLLQKR